ncbi:dihydrofolate reductase family protein [Microbacterium gorillae]|uniref:dihydrofolate reductase family protein n=1 Tax=Microbacterium gorillae TaxID=1231063 RepID=UPI000590304F|nr:dihydrofolate reductase family protein [Microbacterium gorillae]
MSYVTADMAVSLDGYTAGLGQTLETPFGEGALEPLTSWMQEDENAPEVAAVVGAQAYIMGRNMFGPDRGEFDLDWQGWWGPEPPYHAPVFVLSHHEREPLVLQGTTFTFVTEGIERALELAREVAGPDGRIDIAGGACTVNQYLAAGHVDELRLHICPVVLGAGERLSVGVEGFRLEQLGGRVASSVVHVRYRVIHTSA